MVEVFRSPLLEGLPHGFLGRRGGVSVGVAASLNVGLGSGDDEAAVRENRRRAAEAVLPGAAVVALYQTHSADVVVVEEPWTDSGRPRADALVTARPNLLLGIVTADCAPILLADREAGVVGAAHAGWKGAKDGIIAAVVAAMRSLGAAPSRIRAAIGPCIAQASYEVGEDFRYRFGDADAPFFAGGAPGHCQFDLEAYVAFHLEEAGVGQIGALGLDTYANEEAFFSYRRATRRGEATYGRQFSLIALADRQG